MERCYKCGISEDKELLLDVVTPQGILKICRICSKEEGGPLIRGEEGHKMRVPTVYERLVKMSNFNNKRIEPLRIPEKSNTELKSLIEENFTKNYKDNLYLKDTLIDNFQWIVMRARRIRHITQEQLAAVINEPSIVIKFLESGKVKDIKVIEKVESYLRINLRKGKKGELKEYGTIEPRKVQLNMNEKIDFKDTKNLTISHLQEAKQKQDAEKLSEIQKKIEDEIDEEMKGR